MILNTTNPGTAVVIGAAGQDGFFLASLLLQTGWMVHATVRQDAIPDFDDLPGDVRARLRLHQIDLLKPQPLLEMIKQVQPDEIYNLAGQSSVSRSFSDPLYTWKTNAESVVYLLECIRNDSPKTRFYQASSSDMFGLPSVDAARFNEDSALSPQSPYASAKAAAHLLCRSYREVYGLRIASGILANHESHRRPPSFLSRKVVDHVRSLKQMPDLQAANAAALSVGNLKIQRDWGFAPHYAEGMLRILRQIKTRAEVSGTDAELDAGENYRDYILATGKTHAVWELIDSAFKIGGFELEWNLDDDDPLTWAAYFASTKKPAVIVNPELLRAAEPLVIRVDPGRARRELGWEPGVGLELFLGDMFRNGRRSVPEKGAAKI